MTQKRTRALIVIVGAAALALGTTSIASTLPDSPIVDRMVADSMHALARGNDEPSVHDPIILRAPRAPDRVEPAFPEPPTIEPDHLRAAAYQFRTPVYFRASASANTAGLVRRGVDLPVLNRASGSGCEGGRWFRITGGYVCNREGFRVMARESEPRDQRAPDIASALPYEYAAVVNDGAPRYHHLPSEAEERAVVEHLEAVADGASPARPSVLQALMVGDYFVALDRVERGEAGEYYRTVRGRYVRTSDIEVLDAPTFVGEHIDESTPMPVAFVVPTRAPLYQLTDSGVSEVGHAEHHARLLGARVVERGDRTFVVGRRGFAVPRESVRLAGEIDRPDGVDDDETFVHVNLREQTLVAYDADGPVFATLVSSGKEGYETPRGLFRIGIKHVSATMTGSDPVDGRYEVEEVPWTMYFKDSYALHGAYWHSGFGEVRSHGCVNLAPADARFIFAMAMPRVPAGWNTKVGRGTQVYVTQ